MSFDPTQRRVQDEMSTEVVSIQSTQPLLTALDLMDEKGITALPVVDDDGRCTGVISTTDIAHAARKSTVRLQKLADAPESERAKMVDDIVANGIVHQTVHDAMRFKLKCCSPGHADHEGWREDALVSIPSSSRCG